MSKRSLVSVVDDDESVRESLPDLLRQFGFAAQAFSSAEAFLASEVISETICLILDIAMPGMSGPDLQLDAAARDLEWFKRRTADASEWAPRAPRASIQPFYASSAGSLELARGRPAAAVAILRQTMPAIRRGSPVILSPGGSQGQYAAMRLAAALEAVGDVSEAITTLEQAVADRVGVTIGNTPNRWLRTSAQLARLYRRTGQDGKARAIDAHLLTLLAAADADHPLVVELGRRQ